MYLQKTKPLELKVDFKNVVIYRVLYLKLWFSEHTKMGHPVYSEIVLHMFENDLKILFLFLVTAYDFAQIKILIIINSKK